MTLDHFMTIQHLMLVVFGVLVGVAIGYLFWGGDE